MAPALDEVTEEHIEAIVTERVHVKLVDSMRKARDHGRQKVCTCLDHSLTHCLTGTFAYTQRSAQGSRLMRC